MAMICFFVYIGHDPLGKLSDHFNNYLWARFASTREERRENSVQGGGVRRRSRRREKVLQSITLNFRGCKKSLEHFRSFLVMELHATFNNLNGIISCKDHLATYLLSIDSCDSCPVLTFCCYCAAVTRVEGYCYMEDTSSLSPVSLYRSLE